MVAMQIEIREVGAVGVKTCANHGTTMNCPTANCPGVPQVNPAAADEGHDIDADVMLGAVREAVRVFMRFNGRRGEYACKVDDHDVVITIAGPTKSKSTK